MTIDFILKGGAVMPKNANPHEKHRQRVRKEFLENGF